MRVITKKNSYRAKGEEHVNGLGTQMGIKRDKRDYIDGTERYRG